MKILIMGLPGSGKTTIARQLYSHLSKNNKVEWYNADIIRQMYQDWDFSPEGRLRQANRMKHLADNSDSKYVICDFVAPTEEIRKLFNADLTIWLNTIDEGRFDDTNKVFEKPSHVDIEIDHFYNKSEVRKFLKDVDAR